MRTFRIAMAQINPTVGDLDGNAGKIIEYIDEGRALGADVIAFPELAITGYPPEDLLFKQGFLRDADECLKQVAAATGQPRIFFRGR